MSVNRYYIKSAYLFTPYPLRVGHPVDNSVDNLWISLLITCGLKRKKEKNHTLYIKKEKDKVILIICRTSFGSALNKSKRYILKNMVCLNPKPVKFYWYNKVDEKTGKTYKTKALKFATFWDKQDETTEWVPCGKCEGCRIDKANDNATKAYLESQNWAQNAFLTLTYDNAHLPKKRTLIKADLQKFWKKLRKHISPQRIKYLACGEYGPKTLRPHYHAAVFNYWPSDATPYKRNEVKDMLYTSKELQKIWGNGFVIVGKLTYESAAYIARYVYKKAYNAEKIQLKANKTPEYTTCSKNPGLAKNWFENPILWKKIQRNQGVLIPTKTGVKIKPIPMYLKRLWKEQDHENYYKIQEQNKQKQIENQQSILQQTDKNFGWLRQQTNAAKREKLKRLDKFRQKDL